MRVRWWSASPTNAAHNAAGEGNIGRAFTFDVDTLLPVIRDARIDGNELIVAFSEDLDERFVPAAGYFAVSFIRNGAYNTRTVSRVEVVARELFLILARPVESGDAVELFYDDTGAGAVRDLAGNRAFGFSNLAVRNVSRQESVGVPGAPAQPYGGRREFHGDRAGLGRPGRGRRPRDHRVLDPGIVGWRRHMVQS